MSLKALNVLSIRRNKLMALPAWFARLPALERLELEGNPFQGPWRALLTPLIASRPMVSAGISVPGDVLRQQQQQPASSSNSNMNSLYGPGLSMYNDASPIQPSHEATLASNEFPRNAPQLLSPHSAAQGSFFSATDSDPYSMPNSAMEADEGPVRRFLPEEEEHTIVPRSLASSSQHSVHPSSQPPIPPSPLSPMSPSQHLLPSPTTQLPYMQSPSGRPNEFDRFEQALADVHESIPSPGPSPIQRAPTFSVVDRRTPSPYLRPLSRTRTTPSRSRLSSGSGTGSIATFIADQGYGDGGRSRTSSVASQRPRTSSSTSQRPHTDYASTRYGEALGMENPGFYGSSLYGRMSDGTKMFHGSPVDAGAGTNMDSIRAKDEDRRTELRRMRSADELRRALESVIGPSKPMAPAREDDDSAGDTETDRAPPFFVPRVEARSQSVLHHTTDGDTTILANRAGAVRGVTLTDRPGAKRFASLGAAHGLGGSLPTRARPALADGMWDADGDADVEGDGEEQKKKLTSRPMSPTEQDKGPAEDNTRQAKKGKWGFLKKMSMGRMRPETTSRSTNPQLSARSTQTSPQAGSHVQRTGAFSDHATNETSPVAKSRQNLRENPNSSLGSTNTPPPLPSLNIPPQPALSSLQPPSLQHRSAKRRSFLPLDGPPALNIPIPSTASFLSEHIIATNGTAEEPNATLAEADVVQATPSPHISRELPDNDNRALRSVMAYLRDMADLGMSNSAPGVAMINSNPSTFNLGSSSSQDNEDGRSRRPALVENGRVLSEGSLASNASSGSGFGGMPSRSDDQRANTMSVVTTDSGGSGKGDEDRSKHKDDKTKRMLVIKEIVEFVLRPFFVRFLFITPSEPSVRTSKVSRSLSISMSNLLPYL